MRGLSFVLVFILVTAIIGNAESINVPGDFETIQAGIDASEDGDTVLVAAGEYVENINFSGKSICLLGSPENPEQVIINGDANGRSVVVFREGEDENSILSGFTISNGSSDFGAGMYCNGASPIISNSIIQGNVSERSGAGGYFTDNSGATITNVVFSNNSAGLNGGGLCLFDNCSSRLVNVDFLDNSAEFMGGGIFTTGDLSVEDSRFYRNSAQSHGGGIAIWSAGQIEFISGVLEGNFADFGGGMAVSYFCSASIERVVFNSNFGSHGNALFVNSEWDDQYSVEFLGTNLTICHNVGLSSIHYSGEQNEETFLITNSILFENEGPILAEGIGSISYCMFDERDDNSFAEGFQRGEGLISEDPQFIDIDNTDYRLTADSPCIDGGDPDSEPDPDGTRVDMGVFYFHQRDINIELEEMVFEPVETGLIDSLSFVIHNTGGNDLTILSFDWELNELRFFTREEEPFAIEPEGEYVVWVFFEPDEPDEFRSSFLIMSDDPDEDEIGIEVRGSSFSGVRENTDLPEEYKITSIYPNPFNSTTSISYSLPVHSKIAINIYNINGQLVDVLLEGIMPAGNHNVVWDANEVSNGIYFVKMGDEMRKVVLVK